MTKFLAAIFLVVCFLGLSAKAEDSSAAEKQMMQRSLKNLEPISKGEIDSSIDNLVRQGVISAEQAAQAREELSGMNDNEIKALHNQAIQFIGSQKRFSKSQNNPL